MSDSESPALPATNFIRNIIRDDLASGKLTDEIQSTLETVAADLSSKYAK